MHTNQERKKVQKPTEASRSTPRNSGPVPTGMPNSAMASMLGRESSGCGISELESRMLARLPSVQQRAQAQIPQAENEADRISAAVNAGTPESVKAVMGQRMGADFSGVRFHTGAAAAAKADAMGARAFTSGADVYFGSEGFDPSVAAHELVHTAQQGMVDSGMSVMATPVGGVQMMPKWIKKLFGKDKKEEAAPAETAAEPAAGPGVARPLTKAEIKAFNSRKHKKALAKEAKAGEKSVADHKKKLALEQRALEAENARREKEAAAKEAAEKKARKQAKRQAAKDFKLKKDDPMLAKFEEIYGMGNEQKLGEISKIASFLTAQRHLNSAESGIRRTSRDNAFDTQGIENKESRTAEENEYLDQMKLFKALMSSSRNDKKFKAMLTDRAKASADAYNQHYNHNYKNITSSDMSLSDTRQKMNAHYRDHFNINETQAYSMMHKVEAGETDYDPNVLAKLGLQGMASKEVTQKMHQEHDIAHTNRLRDNYMDVRLSDEGLDFESQKLMLDGMRHFAKWGSKEEKDSRYDREYVKGGETDLVKAMRAGTKHLYDGETAIKSEDSKKFLYGRKDIDFEGDRKKKLRSYLQRKGR